MYKNGRLAASLGNSLQGPQRTTVLLQTSVLAVVLVSFGSESTDAPSPSARGLVVEQGRNTGK